MIASLKAAVDAFVRAQPERVGSLPTGVPGLVVTRTETRVLPTFVLYRPVLAVAVQGAKQVTIGGSQFRYADGQALVVGLDVPAVGCIAHASPAEPYVGLSLELDVAAMREVAERSDAPAPRPGDGSDGGGVFVYDCPIQVIDALARLVRLAETPEAIPTVHPLVVRELSYWMLAGPRGRDVRDLVMGRGAVPRVVEAVRTLRENYHEPLRMDDLAAAAGMSPSSFYQHFKALTALTPLQYQKQMRLAEARALLAAQPANVAQVAYRVGYESVSQFHREYKRAFGQPPRMDARVAAPA